MTVTVSEQRRSGRRSRSLQPADGMDLTWYLRFVRDDDDQDYRPLAGLEYLTLRDGDLYLGEIPVRTAQWDDHLVHWVQQTHGHFSTGMLQFSQDALRVTGEITLGTTIEDSVRLTLIGTLPKPQVYTTRITKTRYPENHSMSEVPEGDWTTGRRLRVSDVANEHGGFDTVVELADDKDQFRPMSDSDFYIEDGYYVVNVVAQDAECEASSMLGDTGLYRNARLRFDSRLPNPPGEGEVSEMCSDEQQTPAETLVWLWKADLQPGGGADGDGSGPVMEAALEAPGRYPTRPLSSQVLPGVDAAAVLLQDVTIIPNDLTLNELYTLTPPDDIDHIDEKNAQTSPLNSLMMRDMKWAMGQQSPEKDWLSNFLREGPPVLDGKEHELAEKGATWYRKFSKAYLTKSFEEYKRKDGHGWLSDAQYKKLDNYFKTGIAKESDFTVQNQGLYMEAYTRVVSRLNAYTAGGSGPDWAAKLLTYIVDSPNFFQLYNNYHNPKSMEAAQKIIRKQALLLLALDPGGSCAKEYYTKVTGMLVAKLTADAVSTDSDLIQSWLPTTLVQMLQQIADGTLKVDGLDQVEAKAMLEELNKNLAEISADMTKLLVGLHSVRSMLEQASELEKGWVTTLSKNWPKLASLGRLSYSILWAGAVYQLYVTLTRGDWKTMTDKERAEIVFEVLGTAQSAFKTIPDFYCAVEKVAKSISKIAKWFCSEEMLETLDRLAVKISGGIKNWIGKIGEVLKPLLKDSSILESSVFKYIFSAKMFGMAMKVLGAAIAAALAVLALMDLVEAIKNGNSVEIAWKSVDFAVGFLLAAVLILDLFVASTIIPVIGAVLAVVGVVLAILEWFFGPKPDDPLDDFMKDYGIPFVDGLPEPDKTPRVFVSRRQLLRPVTA